jgi:hypothetical protein
MTGLKKYDGTRSNSVCKSVMKGCYGNGVCSPISLKCVCAGGSTGEFC